MLSVSAFRRLVCASAMYDVLMTGAFATPWSLLLWREQLSASWALLVTGEPVLWLFIVPELAWGVAQSLPLRASGLRQG